jgi:hypothetical protein
MYSIIALISSIAFAQDPAVTTVTMSLIVNCEGKCDEVKVAGKEVDTFPFGQEISVEQAADQNVPRPVEIVVDSTHWLVSVLPGEHQVFIDNQVDYPRLHSPDLTITPKASSLTDPGSTMTLSQSVEIVLAECWYQKAFLKPGTNEWDWTQLEAEGCRWTVPDWQQFDRTDAHLTVRYGADFWGTGNRDTDQQARESIPRGLYLQNWADEQFSNDPDIYVMPSGTLNNRKAELVVTLTPRPKAQKMPKVEYCYEGTTPYSEAYPKAPDADPAREVAGDKNYDGVYSAQDCEVLQDIPIPEKARGLEWEGHVDASIGVSAPALRAGFGFFLPVDKAGKDRKDTDGDGDTEEVITQPAWLHFWGDFGVTPDRSSADGEPSWFNLWQSGFAPPVASWGLGAAWVGPKGFTVGGEGEGFRMTTRGASDLYDISLVLGYTGRFGKSGWFRLAGAPTMTYGRVPEGEAVANTAPWMWGEAQRGPATFWYPGARADFRVGIVW